MNVVDAAKEYFQKQQGLIALILFGSHASGKARERSDIDFAVLFSPDQIPDSMKLIEMRESLCERLNKDVDLVCLNTASPIIGMQVLKNGKKLIVNDRKGYDKYTMNLYTDYADLKRLRKPIEETILKRKFYG